MEGLVTLFWRLTPPAIVLPFLFFLGSYRFSGAHVSRVALIAPDIDKFILWERECDVPKWVYPAEDISNVILAQGGK